MLSKFKAALSSVILAKDRDFAMTAEDVLYEGQTMFEGQSTYGRDEGTAPIIKLHY